MAPGKKIKTKEELLTELALSRQALAADLPELACRCNPVARLQRSFTGHPAAWIAASGIAGLLVTRLLSTSRGDPDPAKKKQKSGSSPLPVLAFLLKTLWPIARPAAEKIVQDRLARMAEESPQETA